MKKLGARIERDDYGEVVKVTLPNQITDDGLVHLAGLTKLETLNLWNTQITDNGLVHLVGLTALRRLGLTVARVTESGLAELERKLPNCKILKR